MQELVIEKMTILEKLNLADSCTPNMLYLLVLENAFRKNPALIDKYAQILNRDFDIPIEEVATHMTKEFSSTRLSNKYIRNNINNAYKDQKQRFNRIRGFLKGDVDDASTINEIMEIVK